ncbi:ABC transporter ATP-binding protein [Aerococcaceae bacterium WGS1372]
MLDIQNLSFQYDDYPVLDDINLQLHQGETVAILGPSGVGKTSLFNLIAGINDIQKGQIEIDGSKQIKGKVSYMLQKDMLYPHYTVIENIMLPRIIQGESKQDARKFAQNLLESFELSEWANYYPHALSGGMRQRVAFMRTAAFGRQWLLLDESFSALDAITRRQLHQWFIDYRQKMGWSSLIITHDVDEALILSDRIYVINGQPGRITYELAVDFKHQNVEEVIFEEEFIQAKQVLLSALKEK